MNQLVLQHFSPLHICSLVVMFSQTATTTGCHSLNMRLSQITSSASSNNSNNFKQKPRRGLADQVLMLLLFIVTGQRVARANKKK